MGVCTQTAHPKMTHIQKFQKNPKLRPKLLMSLGGPNTQPKSFLGIFSKIHGLKHAFAPKKFWWYQSTFDVRLQRNVSKMPFFARNRHLAEISVAESGCCRRGVAEKFSARTENIQKCFQKNFHDADHIWGLRGEVKVKNADFSLSIP